MSSRLPVGVGLLVFGVIVFTVGRASGEPHGIIQLGGVGSAYIGLAFLADGLRHSETRRSHDVGNVLAVVVLLPLAFLLFLVLRSVVYLAAEMLR